MKRAVIVDYGMCNLDSVRRAVEECGADAEVADDPKRLQDASHIILPGVGAFADAMAQLTSRDLVEPLRERVLEGKVPFLGICLGMQLMATRGTEGGDTAGLDLIPARVVRLAPQAPGERVPHVGWNEVVPRNPSPLFEGVAPRKDFYFVHSYHVACENESHVLAATPYCGSFASAIGRDGTVFGVQFHPEKSQKPGFRLLQNFIAL